MELRTSFNRAASSSPARDCLFIDQAAAKCFFLFFSGAGKCASTNANASTRAAEKQKEKGRALGHL